MGVRRHGVPDAAGLERGDAEQKLAGLGRGRHDVLADGALVRCRQAAAFQRHRLLNRDLHRLVTGMGRSRREIEFGGLGRIVRLKDHFGGAHRHIETVFRDQIVLLAVDCHRTGTFADIDDAEFAPFQIGLAFGGGRLFLDRKRNRLGDRESATSNKAFDVGVGERDLVGDENLVNQITVTELLVAGTDNASRVGRVKGLLIEGHGASSVQARVRGKMSVLVTGVITPLGVRRNRHSLARCRGGFTDDQLGNDFRQLGFGGTFF